MAYLPTDMNPYELGGTNPPPGGPGTPQAPAGLTPGTQLGTPWSDAFLQNFNNTQHVTGGFPQGSGGETIVGYTGMPGQGSPPPSGSETGGEWGGPVSPFGTAPPDAFTPPPLPDALQHPFALPTAADLQNTPGYMARYQMGLDARQRSAAARGTILNGGTQKALARYGQDYASGEYSNLVNQQLSERQQQASDYLGLTYGPAWQQNQSAMNRYGTLYGQYQDLIGNNRNSQNDYWNQQLGLLNAGLGATSAGNPGSSSNV